MTTTKTCGGGVGVGTGAAVGDGVAVAGPAVTCGLGDTVAATVGPGAHAARRRMSATQLRT